MRLTAKVNGSYFLLLFFFPALLTGCRSGNSDAGNKTIIKGHFRYPAGDRIYYYSYANRVDKFLAIKTIIDSAIIDQDGNYVFSLNRSEPDLFDLKTDNSVLVNNFYLQPGEKMTINFIQPQSDPEITVDSEAAKRNYFIVSFIDSFYKESSTKKFYYIASNYLSPDQYTSYCDERKQKQLNFYKKYLEAESLNTSFNNFMKAEINYQAAVDKLMYAWKKRMKGEDQIIDSTYYNFLNPALIENKSALESTAYIRFLNLYIKDIYERKVENKELPENKSGKLIPAVEKIKIAEQTLKNPFREIVLYNIIYDDINFTGENKAFLHFSTTTIDTLTFWLNNKYAKEAVK